MAEINITKKALATALKKLMLSAPLEKISVGDITSECGLARKSFYYHFKDKYDLLNWIFETEFEERFGHDDNKNLWDVVEEISQYFYDNRKFYVAAFNVSGQNSFNDYFTEFFTERLETRLKEMFGNDSDSQYYAAFFTDAYHASIFHWLTDYPELSPDDVVRLFKKAVTNASTVITTLT